MRPTRRNFLKLSGLAGISLAASNALKAIVPQTEDRKSGKNSIPGSSSEISAQTFNMCGYAAPRLDKVRIGFIGLGGRGRLHESIMSIIEGVEIKALSDILPDRAAKAREIAVKAGFNPAMYTDSPDAWKKLCERNDIDLVYICTPWNLHTPMAVYAMEHGKHAAIEVPAADTLEECWQLVETSEKTRKHCMMMENCCYDFFELLTLNMARQGFFGELVHCEGAYIHNLLKSNFNKDGYWNMWRLRENASRRGNLYPTHGLGPVCQILDINRGDKMDLLVAMMSRDFAMNETARKFAATDSFFRPFDYNPNRGNITTTTILTNKGRTIMIQHDVTSPNVYSRIHKVSGTRAAALKYPLPPKISVEDEWVTDEEFRNIEEKYTPPIIRKVGELAKKVGGHGGMDFLEDWRLIDCLRNGLPLDQDVYDAALWSAVAPLSEWSVANKCNSVEVPDFTRGAWKTNAPVDISLSQGGNTGVRG